MTATMMLDYPADGHRRRDRDILGFRHRLAETGLFTDEALARLLDNHPREHLDVLTMRPNPPPHERWIAGDAEGMSGADLIQAVRRGRLWLNVRRGMNLHPEYKRVFDALLAEYAGAARVKILSAKGGILLSGPRMGVFYHCDATETMLWHVRGQKTVHVYPDEETYLSELGLEGSLLKENLSDLPYRPEFEAAARQVVLNPGESAAWPLHSPHRVVNADNFNVSVTIEHTTIGSMVSNGVYVANGLLRRRFGLQPNSRAVPKALRPVYWAASHVLKRVIPLKVDAPKTLPRRFDVRLDAPHCIAWRDGEAEAFDTAA